MPVPRMAGDRPEPGSKLKRAAASKLTPVETLDDEQLRTRAAHLLEVALAAKARMSEDEEILEAAKTELAAISQALNLAGLRKGRIGFETLGFQRRSTLQKPLLVEAFAKYGIPLEELERCYVAGEPYLSTRLHVFDVEE